MTETDPFARMEGSMITIDWKDHTVRTQDPTPTEVIVAVDKFVKGDLKSVKLYRTKGRRSIPKPKTSQSARPKRN